MVVKVSERASDKQRSEFDLRWGQQRTDHALFYPNSNWYDERGQLLGYGDLSIDDVQRIKKKLRDDQLFIVIGGANPPVGGSSGAASVEALFESSPFIFAREGQFFVTRLTQNLKSPFEAGLMFTVLTPEEARRSLRGKIEELHYSSLV